MRYAAAMAGGALPVNGRQLCLPPSGGKVAPQGRMRDELAKSRARTGNHRRAAPHPPSGGASGTFPQGGRLTT